MKNASKILELVITFNKVDEIKPAIIDYKTRLQGIHTGRYSWECRLSTRQYIWSCKQSVFTIEVYNDSICLGRGVGASKKKAEQNAAKRCILKISKVGLV